MHAIGRRLGLFLAIVVFAGLPATAAGAPRTFVVNSTVDAVDRMAGDGQCASNGHACTLRAAIEEANAHPGADTVQLPAGTFEIEIPTLSEDLSGTGDFDVVDPVTIAGQGPGATVIDGGMPLQGSPAEQRGLDRLFEIHRSAGDVTLSGLTLREGFSEDEGGALQNWSPGRVRLEAVDVRDSRAGAGGGINNADPSLYPCPVCPSIPPLTIPGGHIELIGATLTGNAAESGGAAVNNASTGKVSILDSEVTLNPGVMIPDPQQIIDPFDPEPIEYIPGPGVYLPNAGAIVNAAEGGAVGTLRIADSEITENYAPDDGAGVLNAGDGIVTIERTTFADNTSEASGGAIHSIGGRVTIADSTITRNLAHADGGGLYSGGDLSALGLRSRISVTQTSFTENEARGSGGAIIDDGDSELVLTDVTVRENRAEDAGGGLAARGRSGLRVKRTTFTANAAIGEGGGAYTASERPITIEDATFADNSAGVPGLEGHDAGGGGLHTEGGPVEIRRATIARNTATADGGGLSIDNHGDVLVTDAVVRDNRTPMNGGGVENSGTRVTFERVEAFNNRASLDGGGIHNSSSGEFTVLDTTARNNRASNGGGFTNASDSTLIVRRSLFYRNVARLVATLENPEEGGYGGGFYSISDGGGLMENTTISSNTATTRGGGMFHDADASFRIVNTTIWRNSAPFGGGISTVESDFVPSIPPQPNPLTLRNTIVAGSTEGGSCDAMLTSDGGNLDSGTGCMFQGVRDRGNSDPRLDALADNGGHTMTHAPRGDSLAVDWGLRPCVETDQRGVARPQHRSCDAGAVEYDGPIGPLDDAPPDTQYLAGPTQNSLETTSFTFTGSDNMTAEHELAYECRLVEHDLTEAPEVVAPWDPVDIELLFVSCQSGWERPLTEEGMYSFEVRAVDRAGNVDPTPAVHTFNGSDTSPPNTLIADKPANPSNSRAATFTFTGTDNMTPPQWLEYECRLDSRDPELWLECFNPTFFSNLTTGQHTLEVRALDGGEMIDPTPARYTWTVGQPQNCDQANITLTAAADIWVDEVNPTENHLFDTELEVRSQATGNPAAVPPEPVVGQNARSLVRFPVPFDTGDCELESATLRLHSGSSTDDRTLEAVPLAGAFRESTATWMNQPAPLTGAAPATASSGDGYREWDVREHVEAMVELEQSHGWVIRDAHESDLETGGDQSFASREVPQDPPENTLPELVLRYEADPAPAPPPPAEPMGPPTTVQCGQVLSESTLVGNDLTNCHGEGLVVGAPNIVVDLNGHTIDGPDFLLENASGQEEGFPAGIRNSGHTNVVIRNGTVQQFGWGVLLSSGTTRTVVEDLTILRNAVAGVELFDADDGRTGNTVQDSRIADNELGVQLIAGSENSLLARNEITGNLGEAIFLQAGGGHRIEANEVHGIPTDPQLDSDGGVLLEGSSGNVFVDNIIRDTGDAGVLMHLGSHRNRVEGGQLFRNGDAGVAILDSDRNVVDGVTAHQESDGGITLNNAHHSVVRDSDLRFNPSGVESSGSNHIVIEGNDASDSRQTGLEIGNGVGIRVAGNVANRSGGDGISLESGVFDGLGTPVGGAVIEDNTANENGGNGIVVSDGGHTIRDNDAHNNADYGIDAGDTPANGGTNVDGGSNRASGNGRLEQCAGVTCVTSGSVPLVGPDLVEPVTAIDTHPPDPSGSTSATFTFSATDGGTPPTAMVFECRIDPPPDPLPEPPDPEPLEPPGPGELPDIDTPPDGEGWAECISPLHLHNLDEGSHHFEVRALDQGDNRDLTPATYDWSIEAGADLEDTGPDATTPETRLVSGPVSPTTGTSATFRFLGSDNQTPGPNLRFECRLDAEPFALCTSPRTVSGIAPGLHTFEVRALDRTGNTDPSPALHTWTVVGPPPDVTPPETTIGSGPDRTTVHTDATFEFTGDEPEATLECALDGAPFAPCSSPLELDALAVGAHELRVRARDAAGNADTTPAAYAWTITAPPVPAHVFCGQVITQSTLVQNDLHDCIFNGIVIGADAITVDLDGHTVDGVGLGAGIRNDGFDSVTIRNGRAVDFDYGVALNPDTTRNIVEGMTVEQNQLAGIALGQPKQPDPNLPAEPPDPIGASQSKVFDNTLRGNTVNANKLGIYLSNGTQRTLVRDNALAASQGEGIWVENSSANRVEDNRIDASSGYGIALEGADGNTVAGNALEGNNAGILVGVTHAGTVGIPSDGNRVTRNALEESGGIEVVESSANELDQNAVTRSTEAAVSLEYARDNIVRDNDLRSNKGGISLKQSSGNRLEGNDASNSESTGIALESLSLSNEVVGNTSNANDGDGIYVGDEAPGGSGTQIEANTASNNKGYGIYVPKPSHVIKGNTTNDNGSWGIWVSEGSNGRVNVDAGGNRAVGNLGPLDPLTLKPLQCYVVRCEGGPTPSSDQIAPETSIIERPPEESSSDAATFRFTGTDNASSVEFQCRLDSAAFAPCESPRSFAVSAGSHTFEVRAVDASGNVDASPAAYTWVVEAQPGDRAPETTIVSGPDHTTVSTEATFTYSADELGATFECALDAAAFAPCTLVGAGLGDGVSFAGLGVGTHTFRVRAVDGAGNTDATPAAWAWTIAPAPVAAEVACGEFITQSTRVTNDLIDCTGNGLIIGAHGITIDLDGHVLDGTSLEAGVLNAGYDSVTVTNGHVHEFDYGIQLNPGSGGNVVSALRVELNQEAGIALSDADENGIGNTVRHNEIRSNGYGVALFSGTRNAAVRDNELVANQADGVYLEHSRGNLVTANEIDGSAGAGVAMIGGGEHTVIANVLTLNGEGVAVGEELLPSDDNRIERNTIEASGGAGLSVNDSSGTLITFNDVTESNGPGAALDLARDSVVRGNDLRGNAGGIELSESSDNLVEFNDAGGALGSGISLEGGSDDNVIVFNTANGNNGEGIEIEDSAIGEDGNLLANNTADSNGGDGIIVTGVGHTLTANRAQLNRGWGIYAPVGAIDGGGNFAAGNVEPGQCVGVVCTLGTVPGTPETHLVDAPPAISNSRNASFTYFGSDDVTPLVDLVFECRLDTTNDLAWEDCDYPHEALNLSPGEHVMEIRAVDLNEMADPTPARHVWTYTPLPAGDPPESFVDLGPEAETWALDALFTFHSNEPDVTFECRVDTHPYEPCGFEGAAFMQRGGFEWGLEETEVGRHTFRVRATDFEGNVGQPATYQWTLLGVATEFLSGPGFTPGTEGEPASGGESTSANATIDFIANVADATYECSLDLEPFAPCVPPVSYTGLTMGDHELRVVATDSEGVSEQEAAIYEWEVLDQNDSVPPETTLERAPLTGSSSTIFEFEGTDNLTPPSLLTFECRLDSTSALDWEVCTSPYNLLDTYTYSDIQMAPGPHVFEVRAVDNFEPLIPDPANPEFAGNVDPTPVRYEWTSVADETAPGTALLAGPAGLVGDLETTFEFTASDNATPTVDLTYECSLDGAAFEPCSSPETFTLELPGEHTFRVRAVDLAGNADATPATRTWDVAAPPVTTITSGPDQLDTSERAIFTFTSNQPDATFECSMDGATFEPCSSPHAAWVVDEGSHRFEVRGVSATTTTELEPIVEDPAAFYEWTAVLGPDVTRPDTEITSGPIASTPDVLATFEFRGSDNRTPPELLSFECSLDGAPFSGCSSPEELNDLTRGEHELLVRAVDEADNVDTTPARYEWSVEPAPIPTVLSGPSEISESTTATFEFTSDVPGSTFECWLDGPKGPCTSPVTYTGLAAGEHIFAVRATSPHGITSGIWAEYDFEIGDTTPPITTINSGPGVNTEDPRAEFAFTANEPGVTFMCGLDGGNLAPCSSPHIYPRLHPGPHRFEVQAIASPLLDPFGVPVEVDYDPVSTIYEWTIVDNVPPETTIDWGPREQTVSLNAVFGVSSDDPTAILECSLDGEPFSECDQPPAYTELERGPHTFAARATDVAGNADSTPAEFDWTITEPGAPNTLVGTNVAVTIPMPDGPGNGIVTFFEVSTAGFTSIDALGGGAPLPAGYSMGGARFYDVTTTAQFSEPATVCLAYDPASFATSAVRLLELDGTVWMDITTLNNPFTGRICGEAEDFAGFAIASAHNGVAPVVSILSGPDLVSNSGTATFEFWADLTNSLITCSLDGLPFAPCTSPVTYTHLEEGDHDFQVQAMGPFGFSTVTPSLYEWEVILPPDTTGPDTTITKGPGAITGNFISNFEFTGFDDQTHELELDFECSVDGGPFEGCSVPEEVEVLTPGEHTFRVRAVDETLNVDPTPATRTWTVVDVSAPDTSIESGPNSETEATSATFTFIGEEENGTAVNEFECALDSGDFAPCSPPHTVDGAGPGPHVLHVRAVDPDGNADATPDFYEWLVIGPGDTIPPDTTIVTHPPATSGPDVLFGFLSNEATEGFECSLDGGAFEDCESVHELTDLASGAHNLAVRAVDLFGNIDPTPASYGWNALGVPDTAIDSRPPDPSPSMSATFTFSSDQDGVTFQCSVDGSDFTPCTSPFVAGPLLNLESHEFEVRAVSPFVTIDGEPIVDESPASYEFDVLVPPEPPEFDTRITSMPPVVAIGGPDAISTFAFESDPPGNIASFECSLDGETFDDCEMPVSYDGLPDGEHTFRVRAVDLSENPDLSPATYTWVIEAAPETALISGPATGTESTTATFEFSSPSPTASFECSLDAAAYVPCASPVTYTGVPYGEHEFLVRARGPVGSVDQTPESHTWETGLLTPPVAVLGATPAATTSERTATFTFSSTDPDAVFLCSLDGATPSFCSSPKVYTDLAPGVAHTFEVQATKPHLLVESDPATFEWTIEDVTAPETTITTAPPGLTPLTDALFEFAGTDDGTLPADLDFECALDGAAFAGCSSPAELNELAVGEHSLAVRATDAAGNTDQSPAVHTWRVVELTQIDSGPASPSASPRATLEFSGLRDGVVVGDASFQCSLDGADFAACSSPHEVSALENGEHTLAVRASTTFGVWDVTPAVHTWTVALPPGPETAIDAAPDAITPLTSATFAFSADQPDATFQCSLDGAAFAPCTSPREYTGLAGGPHHFAVRALSAGEIPDASPAVHDWTIDLPPDTTIDAGPPATTIRTTALFEVSSDDPAATFECALDGAAFGSCSATPEFTQLAVGEHELQVRAKDDFGSVDPSPAVHGWTVESFETTIDSAPDDPTESRTATFEFSADRAGATFECQLDDEPGFTPCTSPKTYNGLPDGDHEFLVRARDVSGDLDPTPAEHSWEIGEIPPPVTITSAPPATTMSRSASFAFGSDKPGTTFECALDAAPFAPCDTPKEYALLAVGEHTFQVRARSVDPVVPAPIATHAWTIEPLPPCTMTPATLTATADSWIDQSSPTANKGTDSVLKVMSKGPANNLRALVRFDHPALDVGCTVTAATLRLHAASAAGGRTLHALRLTGGWEETAVTWADQPGTAGAAAPTTSGTGYRELDVATQVRAMYAGANHGFLIRDAVENGDAEQQLNSRENAIERPQLVLTFGAPDFNAPETTIGVGPQSGTQATSATFEFSSDEPGVAFECALDGEAFAACSSPKTYTGLSDGAHAMRVRATDLAGNVDASAALHEWTIAPDTTAPETTLGPGAPPATTSSTNATFSLHADEAGSTFECSLDGGAFAACTSPKDYSGVAVGAHEFRVRATDAAGNTDGSPASHAWTVTPACASVTAGSDRDSWVLQSASGSNFGTDSNLKVDSKSGNSNARALVRFALPAIPAGCTVTGATLRLYAGSYKENRTLQAQRVSASWTEAAVTWGNQPATTGTTVTAPSRTSPGWVQWSVTALVQSMYSGANHGFRIRDATENGGGFEQVFNSRETSQNQPQLVITFG